VSFDNIDQTEHSAVKIKFCFIASLCHQQPVNSATWNNHSLIPLTVSHNLIN